MIKQDVLREGREPGEQGESFASVAIGDDTADRLAAVLLVEAQVDPAHEPSELDDDPWTLESNDAENGGKREVGHRDGLWIVSPSFYSY